MVVAYGMTLPFYVYICYNIEAENVAAIAWLAKESYFAFTVTVLVANS